MLSVNSVLLNNLNQCEDGEEDTKRKKVKRTEFKNFVYLLFKGELEAFFIHGVFINYLQCTRHCMKL